MKASFFVPPDSPSTHFSILLCAWGGITFNPIKEPCSRHGQCPVQIPWTSPTSALSRFPTAKICIFVSEDCPQTHKKASLPVWQSRSTQEITQPQEQPSTRLQGHKCPKALTFWRNKSGAYAYIVSQCFSVGLNPYYSWFNNTILLVTFSFLYHSLTPLLVHSELLI